MLKFCIIFNSFYLSIALNLLYCAIKAALTTLHSKGLLYPMLNKFDILLGEAANPFDRHDWECAYTLTLPFWLSEHIEEPVVIAIEGILTALLRSQFIDLVIILFVFVKFPSNPINYYWNYLLYSCYLYTLYLVIQLIVWTLDQLCVLDLFLESFETVTKALYGGSFYPCKKWDPNWPFLLWLQTKFDPLAVKVVLNMFSSCWNSVFIRYAFLVFFMYLNRRRL